jgi:hypothetical protein
MALSRKARSPRAANISRGFAQHTASILVKGGLGGQNPGPGPTGGGDIPSPPLTVETRRFRLWGLTMTNRGASSSRRKCSVANGYGME